MVTVNVFPIQGKIHRINVFRILEFICLQLHNKTTMTSSISGSIHIKHSQKPLMQTCHVFIRLLIIFNFDYIPHCGQVVVAKF
jgi:hypothetical protein